MSRQNRYVPTQRLALCISKPVSRQWKPSAHKESSQAATCSSTRMHLVICDTKFLINAETKQFLQFLAISGGCVVLFLVTNGYITECIKISLQKCMFHWNNSVPVQWLWGSHAKFLFCVRMIGTSLQVQDKYGTVSELPIPLALAFTSGRSYTIFLLNLSFKTFFFHSFLIKISCSCQ